MPLKSGLYFGFLDNVSINEVLNPNFLAKFELVTASNCLGSPANVMLGRTVFAVEQTPANICQIHIESNRIKQHCKTLLKSTILTCDRNKRHCFMCARTLVNNNVGKEVGIKYWILPGPRNVSGHSQRTNNDAETV